MKQKYWVISTNMGYGHQRAAYALKDIAIGHIITANDDEMISTHEKHMWKQMQRVYESISRLSTFPFFGKILFWAYDQFQKIKPLYPFRDLSVPNIGVFYMKSLLERGLCKSLLTFTHKKEPKRPLVSSFYLPALAADYNNYKQRVFCIVTDTDINRVWVPEQPSKSKIIYLAPTERTKKRLLSYGVQNKNIQITGFPLPKELVGNRDEIMHEDFAKRIYNLDPRGQYNRLLHKMRGFQIPKKSHHPLTITFVIGGAGAQQHILYQMTDALKQKIKGGLRFRVLFGTHLDHASDYEHFLDKIGLGNCDNLEVQVATNLNKYFESFVEYMHDTDILITKPSEMSFYAALGIPIIALPSIGAHEEFNLRWLRNKGCVVMLDDPNSADEWIFDLLEQGVFAKSAIDGYFFAEHRGVYHIEEILEKYEK